MNNCNNFLNTLLLLYLSCFLIFLTLQFINNPIEGFVDLGIMKKCNKIKRQCKARMTIIKNGAERKVNRTLQKAYNNIKTVGKKIIFPKEIKISF
jgi:hypothetical protein